MDHPAWTRAKLAAVAKCLHVTLQPYFSLSVMDDEDEQVHSMIYFIAGFMKTI